VEEVTIMAESNRTRTKRPEKEANGTSSSSSGTPSGTPGDPELAIRLLDEWAADESGYDERIWPLLKIALDEDRLSSRKLFDD
jgi:hypothetical protein